MVQEVQQQGNWYQTPNEIQWIWNVRRRVREHTQVTPEQIFYCSAYWTKSAHTKADGSLWPLEKAVLSITSSYGTSEFKVIQWGIRIPQAWWYEIKITWRWGWYGTAYHYISTWFKDYLVMTTQDSSNYKTVYLTLNLWKYDMVSLWAWASAPAEAVATIEDTITITKL